MGIISCLRGRRGIADGDAYHQYPNRSDAAVDKDLIVFFEQVEDVAELIDGVGCRLGCSCWLSALGFQLHGRRRPNPQITAQDHSAEHNRGANACGAGHENYG